MNLCHELPERWFVIIYLTVMSLRGVFDAPN